MCDGPTTFSPAPAAFAESTRCLTEEGPISSLGSLSRASEFLEAGSASLFSVPSPDGDRLRYFSQLSEPLFPEFVPVAIQGTTEAPSVIRNKNPKQIRKEKHPGRSN
ncbi:uncharacterized protein DS421_18g610100 [Arachis hypogaea]|nr:uncharacterized protein DS421_18g610100 [Arachis hypogaea]